MNQTLLDAATKIVAESGIDFASYLNSMQALLVQMVSETGCKADVAALYIAHAVRLARKPMVIDDHTPAEQFDA